MLAALILAAAVAAPRVEGWTPPPVPPLVYVDTLAFHAPALAVVNEPCAPTGQAGEAFEYVEVWRCAFQNDWARYQSWAPWMLAWHLHRRIYCAPGQRVLYLGLRRFHHRVRAVDASGNAGCWSAEVALQ